MKQLCVAFGLCLLALSGFAQRDQTLFNQSGRVGFFGAPIWEFSNFDGNTQTSGGGGLALILGDVYLGGYGIGDVDFDDLLDRNARGSIDLAHGGLWLGYVPMQYRVVHPYSSLKIGWGAVGIEIDDNDIDIQDGVFVLTPEIGAEVNLFRWLRVAGTVSYRWLDGINESSDFRNKDFREFGANITLRIGIFGREHNRWKHDD